MKIFKNRFEIEKIGKYFEKRITYNWLGIKYSTTIWLKDDIRIKKNNARNILLEACKNDFTFDMLILQKILTIILEKNE